ncbi:hypothetical protein PVK06_047711 [Gossypium arboreum]|uniref:Uncharacterized protein n=1 Tax=Gossypium arboreum TaxID=29729 RepID=A0ABR0ME13_GOSAR|nr:hypothetical protein PVK06_047711 [Gossypium arboreum]
MPLSTLSNGLCIRIPHYVGPVVNHHAFQATYPKHSRVCHTTSTPASVTRPYAPIALKVTTTNNYCPFVAEPTSLAHLFYHLSVIYTRCDPISLDIPSVVKFWLLGTMHSLSLTAFNIALSFVTEDYSMPLRCSGYRLEDGVILIMVYVYRLTGKFGLLVDPLDARCLDLMGLLLGTPSFFYFVPLGVCTAPTERVFRRKNHDNEPTQGQPSMTIEQCLERIEVRLNTFVQQLADLIAIIRE